MARLEMRDDRHLDIWLGHPSEDPREVIIDAGGHKDKKVFLGDVRVTDHRSVVKVRFDPAGNIRDILVDDIFVWTGSRDETDSG